jgi:thiol-disulfide isomerase/thioredoxin
MKRQALVLASLLLLALGARAEASGLRSLGKADEWLNAEGRTVERLEGKVVLVDFWTYTCVNWLRTLPYLRAWQEKYRDQGLVIVGVHSPEFEFEKDADNVGRAVQRLRIDYPVALDSRHAIWRAYQNQYWPAVYLIDRQGRVRFRHFGEGNYAGVEREIQRLLADEAREDIPSDLVSIEPQGAEAGADWNNLRSPENYLGYLQTSGFSSPEHLATDRSRTYSVPSTLDLNSWALSGEWTLTDDSVRLVRSQGRIAYRFHARDANLVMRLVASDRPVRFRVLIDGKPPGDAHGADVDANGNGVVSEPRLYQLIRQPGRIDDRLLEIEFRDANVEAYSFTFG